MTETSVLLVTDLRGQGPVAELRLALTTRSVEQLCARGDSVVVVPAAGDVDAVALLAARLRQRGLLNDGEPGEAVAGSAVMLGSVAELPSAAVERAVLLDAITLGDCDRVRALPGGSCRPGPAAALEIAAASRIASTQRPGFVLGGPLDRACLQLLEYASERAHLVFAGGEGGLAWAREVAGRPVAERGGAAEVALGYLEAVTRRGARVLWSEDVVVRSPSGVVETVNIEDLPDEWEVVDVGPRSGMGFAAAIRTCDAVLWRGGMGAWETPAFALGTRWIGEAQAGHLEGFRVAVGDDTVAVVSRFNQAHRLSHVSPSGDAFVSMLVSGAHEDPVSALGIAIGG